MEFSQEAFIKQMNEAREGSVWQTLDITLLEATPDRVVASLPIGPAQRQQMGYLHGGVSVVLAESVASIGTVLNIDMEKQMAFGLEINANHIRPKKDGRLTATATPIHKGRTTMIWEIHLTDEQDKLICVSRCTVAVVDRPPDRSPFLQGPTT